MTTAPIPDYGYASSAPSYDDEYIARPVLQLCKALGVRTVLDVGCGNGLLARRLVEAGFDVTGCDPSESGIVAAQSSVPRARFFVLGVDNDPAELGSSDFDVVVCTEVIEHLYDPAALLRFARKALKPGGYLIVSTPYHGYLKNLVLSVTNGWDAHWGPLWHGGHIKFWSARTLRQAAEAEEFTFQKFIGAGRFVGMWKSMIVVFSAPSPGPSRADQNGG